MAPDELRRIVAKNIRSRRVELDITQLDLAETLGTSQAYVSQLERGNENLTLALLSRIADALRIQPDLLLRAESFLAIHA